MTQAVSLFGQTYLPALVKAGTALAIIAAFYVVHLVVRQFVRRAQRRSPPARQDAINLVWQGVRAGLWCFAIITALGTVGINVTALVAGLGLTGFALGFALKDALSNLLAGVLLLIYRPFGRGDRIVVSGFEGVVEEIDLRYTTLQAGDRRILLPNSTLFSNPVSILEAQPPGPET